MPESDALAWALDPRVAAAFPDIAKNNAANPADVLGQLGAPTAAALAQVLGEPVRKGMGLLQTMRDYSANEFPATQGATSVSTDYDPRRAAADYAAGTALNVTGAPGVTGGVPGLGMGIGARTFWRGTNPGDPRRIKTGNDSWDSHLFVADNKDAASQYGKHLTQYEADPDAKILYEGTQEFVNVAGRWRKGESLLDYSARASEAAKAAGYDAAWFKRQGDVGTAIFNPQKFKVVDE